MQAATIGLGASMLLVTTTFAALSIASTADGHMTFNFVFLYNGVIVLMLGSAVVYVSYFRYKRIPTFDRKTSNV